ncbi:MAG TPA: hypothetical protein VM431_12770 [Phycisphaerae bacterium]|nr:hypothetical protein [Phycisphaerae bacterium]
MRTAHRRLAKVEADLTPKQRVLQWLDEALEAGSTEAYCRQMFDEPVSEWPGTRLTEAVAEATRKRLRGYPREAVESRARDAARDILFLLSLVGETNRSVTRKVKEFTWAAALCARGIEVAVLRPEAGGNREATLSRRGLTLSDVRSEIVAFAAQVSLVRHAVNIVSRRYFDGHPILFPGTAESLSEATKTSAILVEAYNEAVSDLPRGRGKGGRREGVKAQAGAAAAQPIEETDLGEVSAAVAEPLVRQLVADAKAGAAWQVGQSDLAARILRGTP